MANSAISTTMFMADAPSDGDVYVRHNAAWASIDGVYVPDYSINNGRLTLVSGNPFPPTDTTAASTLYFTPYTGSRIAYYDGSSWSLRTFSEVSLDISVLTADTNYDIFIYDSSGTFALYAVAWASATSRATALYVQDGVHVLTGATNYNYLGTIRTTGTTGKCEVSFGKTAASGGSYPRCLLWNYRNRIMATFSCFDSTDSWTYTTNTWRQKNNSTSNKFDFVNGIGRESITIEAVAISANSTSGVQRQNGIGYDVTNNASTSSIKGSTNETTPYAGIPASYKGMPAAGYHYFAEVEKSAASGTTTWYGDGGESVPWSGMTISWWF